MSVEACRDTFPAVTFAFPEDLRLSAWSEHVPFAFWLIPVLRPRILVELGTYRGMSFLAFCQSVVASGTDTHAYAVDSWEGDAHAGALPPEIYADVKAVVDLKYAAFATLLRMDFDTATAHVADGSVDLLHIDGFHTYEAVSHDFETWRGKLSPDAVVLFHDTQVFERGFGVNRFWNEVRTQGGSFEFHHGHGLGVLAFGAARQRLVALMEAGESDTAYLRALFARLGRGLTDCQGRIEAEQRQHEAEAEIGRLSSSKDYRLGHTIRGLMSGRL
ncbi:class I SAM-dependent methyltransferase [Xanthobacter oligotrophicus]|uniref:Class I SAM-dependent methyltransferase n=1 Tax=Xanthobacter oligotrophicus TaxID=2607286 RepID=A0ABW6ZQZ6_9HYPH